MKIFAVSKKCRVSLAGLQSKNDISRRHHTLIVDHRMKRDTSILHLQSSCKYAKVMGVKNKLMKDCMLC